MFSAAKASERAQSTLRKSRKSHVVVVLGRQRDRSTKKCAARAKLLLSFSINLSIIYLTLSLASPSSLLLRLPNNITKHKQL